MHEDLINIIIFFIFRQSAKLVKSGYSIEVPPLLQGGMQNSVALALISLARHP